MNDFFKEIFAYHSKLNRETILYFQEHETAITPQMRRLFCHMLNAHQLWNARILNTPAFSVFQLHEPEKYPELERHNTELSLNILQTYPLSDLINYQDTQGNEFENSIKEILFHIGNHHMHHRGQLMTMLRDAGLEPLIIDYIYVSRKPRQSS
ncbi:hypothetical protein E7Z59_07855 [Robertkochia marina]|uniref:Damage-inducible protein DinB n=1 Tax=Robertkochia marina TaxID=1227945 RepID=A0A4S3M0K6_9FLAO|nr:DinB family protein [Robertkochia marina]THD67567.1 hypothetical protein E7Z59_07855 [Robertkochia marina]TRZ44565.1 hypothetical protein D3A96_08090 [Robertkochia marina]